MHEGQLPIDDRLVDHLLSEQFPTWAGLPRRRFPSSGTVHAIYRLGDEYAIRLPLLPTDEAELLREWEWLEYLSPQLPLQIPEPVALGKPSERYPSHWTVTKWLSGQNATRKSIRSMESAARSLGRFVSCLRGIGTNGKQVHHYRGEPLSLRDSLTRQAIAQVTAEYETNDLLRAWESALRAGEWKGPPRLFHGDLHSGNLISLDGRLSGVIDFGSLGTGDPSVDGIAGWWLFSGGARSIFRETAQLDRDSWDRARGWALSIALIALPYYRDTNRAFANLARDAINEVLSDAG